jgi:MFS family permease
MSASPQRSPSWRSRLGLNAANFFLAELVGVVLPFLNDFLRGKHWRYDHIGFATSLAGLGVFLLQTPAGFLVDRVPARRVLLAVMSIALGVSFGLLPLVPARWPWIGSLLFIGGATQAFFAPLLAALALGLVGHAGLNRMMGTNQSWNHAGNLAAALSAMALVSWFGIEAVFYAVFVVSVLSAASIFLVKEDEVDERHASGDGDGEPVRFRQLFRDRRVVILFIAVALFHLANAPVMPLVALDIKHLGGTDRQVAAVVLVAQAVMVPVALAAGWLCDRWGRKPIFAIGFVVLPLRILCYAFAHHASTLVALQALDGIGAGIYGVVVVAVCADLTHGKGGFNALNGVLATALSVGGVIGPLGSGLLVQHLGFNAAFYAFALLAAAGAVVLVFFMPETAPGGVKHAPATRIAAASA